MNLDNSKLSLLEDQSNHSLNNSTSKQKFSFPKANRFNIGKSGCDSFYEIPTTKTKRAPSFGYGTKDIGIRLNKYAAEPGSYTLDSQFGDKKKGMSFGTGREDMEMGGPMKNSLIQRYIPGPGRYRDYSTLDNSKITLKARIRDHSQDHLLKNPGPGQYKHEELGQDSYYVSSKHKNKTNFAKIAPPTVDKPVSKSVTVGPGHYKVNQAETKADGQYMLAKIPSTKARQFSKSPRESLVLKQLLSTPGPGNYTPFRYFS